MNTTRTRTEAPIILTLIWRGLNLTTSVKKSCSVESALNLQEFLDETGYCFIVSNNNRRRTIILNQAADLDKETERKQILADMTITMQIMAKTISSVNEWPVVHFKGHVQKGLHATN